MYLCPMGTIAASFEDFRLNKQLLSAIAESGYQHPSPIQLKAIPAVLAGHDVMGIAQTGTGKTAAYVLPTLMKIKYAQHPEPRALILVPTRELALQVAENISRYARFTDIRHVVVFGGIGPKSQIAQLKEGTDILVGTPGRILELYKEGHVILKKLQVFIMDEADRLMDMGFIRQIHSILEIVPRKRQNLLFSATMSTLVKKIADDFLKFPTIIEIEPDRKTATNVEQSVYYPPNFKTKRNLLVYFLETLPGFDRVLIFCRTKEIANRLYEYISLRFGEEAVRVIHGNKAQNTRINSINAFKEGNLRLLIATDVVARGIDVSHVSHVINFDVPFIYEDYIHRIGRTGRAAHLGDSITFCTDGELYHLQKIQQLIRQQIPEKQIPEAVFIEETGYDERQEMAREIDKQKRKDDPEFKGAFHEKKPYVEVKKENKRKMPWKKKTPGRR
jgi:ATP-dependent RNA helicase RhlE